MGGYGLVDRSLVWCIRYWFSLW